MKRVFAVLVVSLGLVIGTAQEGFENRIDVVRPDAPELAAHGEFDIGVRTVELSDPDGFDVVNAVAGEDIPTYDRPLTLEVWYPATLEAGQEPGGEYTVVTRDPGLEVTVKGLAVRDAAPNTEAGPFPLIIISHGYPGNRFLMSHLGENLATKGYVTVAIDHTDSTYSDQAAFASTLLNRPLDQLYVLEQIANLGAAGGGKFLEGVVDATQTGIIGYSMGGYGVVNVVGGGYAEGIIAAPYAPADRVLELRSSANEDYLNSMDSRIKAVIAVAPWGMNVGAWDAESLQGVTTPIMFMAGSADDVSGYENGTKAIYDLTTNAERYLLTFENANHNAAAPMPAPIETWEPSDNLDFVPFEHYGDAVWDTVRMNNIAQHFATAFFDHYIKSDEEMAPYLDLVEQASEGIWSVDDAGEPTDEHTYWQGFPNRTAVGLSLMQAKPE